MITDSSIRLYVGGDILNLLCWSRAYVSKIITSPHGDTFKSNKRISWILAEPWLSGKDMTRSLLAFSVPVSYLHSLGLISGTWTTHKTYGHEASCINVQIGVI
jgi:hypothetical protein